MLERGILSGWQKPRGQMAHFLLGGCLTIPKHTAWLRECRLGFSHCLPLWPGAFALCRKHTPVLVSLLGLWSNAAISKLCNFISLRLGSLMWIKHWGQETWVRALSPSLRSWEVLDIGRPYILVWKMKVGKLENLEEYLFGFRKLGC